MRTLQEQMKMEVELKEKELELREAQNKVYQLTDEEIYNLMNDEAKEKHKKTNALRILDTHKIPYSISEYEWSEERAAGLHVVEALRLDEKQVFKTLVGKGDKTGYVVFCIPVAEELDMKQAARVSHNKSVELVHVKDLLGITGYLRGGCSPVGMKKAFPTYFDATMEPKKFVYVSAGLRGMQMKVDPKNLASVVNAEFVELTMDH